MQSVTKSPREIFTSIEEGKQSKTKYQDQSLIARFVHMFGIQGLSVIDDRTLIRRFIPKDKKSIV